VPNAKLKEHSFSIKLVVIFQLCTTVPLLAASPPAPPQAAVAG